MFAPHLLLLLAGCPEYHPTKTTPDPDGEGPAIEVTPDRLDFGLLEAGGTATRTFTVWRVGTTALELQVR